MGLSERFTHRRIWLIGGALALLLAAVGAFLALDGGDDGGLPGLTPLAQAAERTAEYPGARMRIEGSFEAPGQGTIVTMTGEGEYNGTTGLSRITLTAVPAGQAGGKRFVTHQVAEARPGTAVMYQRTEPPERLPGGAEWAMIDLSGQVGWQANSLDPREQLKALRTSKEFERLGTERVRGVTATVYRATVDLGHELERLREDGEHEAADLLEKVIKVNDGIENQRVEAWVGRDRTIHRMRMEVPFSMGVLPAGTTMHMTMDLFDFGIEPHIEVPDESDVFDATEIANEALDRLAE